MQGSFAWFAASSHTDVHAHGRVSMHSHAYLQALVDFRLVEGIELVQKELDGACR